MRLYYNDWKRDKTVIATNAAVAQTIKKHQTWLGKLTRDELYAGEDKIRGVVTWMIRFVADSPTTDLHGWAHRGKSRVVLFNDAAKASKSKDGLRAIDDLFNLAISELAASAPWLKEIDVTYLPGVRSKATPTEAQLENLKAARAAKAAQAAEKRSAQGRRIAEMTGVGT